YFPPSFLTAAGSPEPSANARLALPTNGPAATMRATKTCLTGVSFWAGLWRVETELSTTGHAPSKQAFAAWGMVPDPGQPGSGTATRRATARFQGSANTVSWPPSDV